MRRSENGVSTDDLPPLGDYGAFATGLAAWVSMLLATSTLFGATVEVGGDDPLGRREGPYLPARNDLTSRSFLHADIMYLENATAVPAQIVVAELAGQTNRIGVLTAKATYLFDVTGQVQLDTQSPFPLLTEDVATPLGCLPTDGRARRSEKFEVMLLGNAYAPRRGASAVKVALAVGPVRREILVLGDRVWVGDDPKRATMSQPKPFEVMPLVYERSFGGTAAVQIDSCSFLDIAHPINPLGKGFDARPQADGLGKMLRAPKGFPVVRGPRPLPNLEDPRSLIGRWDDSPSPVGWGPAPAGTAIAWMNVINEHLATVSKMQQQGSYSAERFQQQLENAGGDEDPDVWIYRAHPDWVIPLPQAAAVVRMENLVPGAPVVELRLPQLRLVADYTLYGKRDQRDLRPQALVLLPDQKRFYLVYRLAFNFEPGPAHERSFRLRTDSGWPLA